VLQPSLRKKSKRKNGKDKNPYGEIISKEESPNFANSKSQKSRESDVNFSPLKLKMVEPPKFKHKKVKNMLGRQYK
jgi:hypothetical protein